MQTLRKFTYPMFMGICSLFAALADILQNPAVFVGILTVLLAIGLLATLVPQRLLSGQLLQAIGLDPEIGEALRPFGLSCFLLALLVYVFSSLSAQAADDGGALASSFPEIRTIQLSLGAVERQVGEIAEQTAEIKKDTDELVNSTVKWLSLQVNLIALQRTTTEGEEHFFSGGFYVGVTNETGQIYEDISFLVSDENGEILSEQIPLILQDGYHHSLQDDKFYERIEVCLSGKRRGRNEWITERRVYQSVQKHIKNEPIYQVVEATGAELSPTTVKC